MNQPQASVSHPSHDEFAALLEESLTTTALQEGNVVPISVIRGLPTIEALGFYPTWQTLLAQLLLLGLFVFAVAKTFWPKRSVTLPTISAPAPTPPVAPDREVTRLRMEIDNLNARIASLEEALRSRVPGDD